MVRTDTGGAVSRRSMEKYSEAMHLYGTTTESVKSLARRFGFNDCSFGQFIRRNFPNWSKSTTKSSRKKENKINNRLSYAAPLRKISCHRQSDKIQLGYLLSK